MDAAQTAYNRLLEILYKHKTATENTEPQKLDGYIKEFRSAVEDDLNLPLALGVLWTMTKEKPSNDIYKTALLFDEVLGLDLKAAKAPEKANDEPVPDEVKALAEKRLAARKNKNWAESDRLREQIAALGYSVTDGKDGFTVKKM